MHTLSIPQSVVERVIERRGREHIYDNLDPAKTALVVVDMQNAFMLPGVAHALCPMAEKIVPNINRPVTNVCCESTARDAMMLNFKTIMVSDGNAAVTDQDHNASLCAFYLTFGDVMSTDMLIACLERAASSNLAAAE
jgi:nicotinamidase-related amidase